MLHDALAVEGAAPCGLVAYYERGDEVWAFVVHPGERRIELERLRFDTKQAARSIAQHFASAGTVRAFASGAVDRPDRFDELVGPIVRHFGPGEPVCIVSHGALHSLPFHVLRAEGEQLIDRHPVSYAPSATFAALARQVRWHRSRAPEVSAAPATPASAVFGDPQGDLPRARREASEVADLLGTTPVVGGDATPDAVRDALAHCDVVHVAGHAAFDRRDPLRSGLALAGGPLRASDVLSALRSAGRAPSLVVLSGCATGAADVRAGDELFGLVRGFLAGGVASLVVSLWEVRDRAAGTLMTTFHRRLREGGGTGPVSRAEALRSAQLALRARRRGIDVWAPFVIVGSSGD